MIYIFETELSTLKTVKIALKKIYGLGNYQTTLLCKQLGFSSNLKITSLTNEQIAKLIRLIESSSLVITSELKKLQVFNLKLLIDIKCYKGLRRLRGLPVRGQRTHTNSKNSKYLRTL